jgi:hypothetical protein
MQLYELETAYLSAEHSQCGTVLKVRIAYLLDDVLAVSYSRRN